MPRQSAPSNAARSDLWVRSATGAQRRGTPKAAGSIPAGSTITGRNVPRGARRARNAPGSVRFRRDPPHADVGQQAVRRFGKADTRVRSPPSAPFRADLTAGSCFLKAVMRVRIPRPDPPLEVVAKRPGTELQPRPRESDSRRPLHRSNARQWPGIRSAPHSPARADPQIVIRFDSYTPTTCDRSATDAQRPPKPKDAGSSPADRATTPRADATRGSEPR